MLPEHSGRGLVFSDLVQDLFLQRDDSARLIQSTMLSETQSMPSSSLELSTRGGGIAIRSFK